MFSRKNSSNNGGRLLGKQSQIWKYRVVGIVTLLVFNSIDTSIATTKSSNHTNTIPSNNMIPTMDDYFVQGLEEIEPAYRTFHGNMYAGLIPTIPFDLHNEKKKDDNNNDDGRLMFWLFEPNQPIYDDTIIIWMNGGPGCSSLGGCLFEHCPVTIPLHPAGYYPKIPDPDILQPNRYAWTNITTMLYVEHPVGTGFSKMGSDGMPHDETEVAEDFYFFLQNLYTIFPPSFRMKRLYIFGESYAGMYVPAIAHYIYERNKEMDDNIYPPINLAGIGLGNGWMDANIQGPAVIDYAYWHGMIDSHTMKALHNEWHNCQHGYAILAKDQFDGFHEFTTPDECGIMGAVLAAAGADQVSWGKPNAYDVSTWDEYLMLDDPNAKMATFYNDPLVQKALHVEPGSSWVECMPGAGRRKRRQLLASPTQRKLEEKNSMDATEELLPGQILLAHDEPISVVPYVADLLDNANINVLVYNGDLDMTTNAQGSEYLLDHMKWNGATGWSNTTLYQRGLWIPMIDTDNTTFGGYMKQYKNLQFLIVSNSGHLVPFNRPKIAYELILRFLGNISFIDIPLPKFNIAEKVDNGNVAETQKGKHVMNGTSNIHLASHRQYAFSWSNIICIGTIGFLAGLIVSRLVSDYYNNHRHPSRQGYDVIHSDSIK